MTPEHRSLLVKLAFSVVPPQFRQWSVIAGGFAACDERASDVDVYMLGNPNRDQVYQWLNKQGIGFKMPYTGWYGNTSRSMADIQTPFKTIQLIGAPQPTVEDLLDLFDITTHMWALKEDGTLIKGAKATGTDEPGRIWLPNLGTPARVEKLQRRYAIDIE